MRSGAKGLCCQVVPALNMKYLAVREGGMICLILTPRLFVLDFLWRCQYVLTATLVDPITS
jgi:hypothetical protein